MSKENFKNNSCFQFQEDKFTNTFSILSRLQAGNCGVQSSQNSTHVTYVSNLLITSEASGIITRNDNLTVIVSCVYPLDLMISLSQVVKPISKSTIINVGGTGQFTVTMALFNDSSYLFPFVGSQVSLSFKETLYVGIYIQGGDNSTYVLLMKNCYATPSSSPNDTLKYYIIKDSCPNKQDSSISVSQNGASREGRVSVQMFKFVGGNYDSVYLHCSLSLCNAVSGGCTPGNCQNTSLCKGSPTRPDNSGTGKIAQNGAADALKNCIRCPRCAALAQYASVRRIATCVVRR
ncbi:unnamed protein product [Ranitomeya imitator]|uniref:ZP domain-containing protein n=1 Tax=Ranitomeya imitator TaxID=111125 RepID=A0ABN9MQR5_9NEOB|nr:unnamed protein product [Ranitomeya imitator]